MSNLPALKGPPVKYTRRVVEEAAALCSMAASEPDFGHSIMTIAIVLGIDDAVSDLAYAAHSHAYHCEHWDDAPEPWSYEQASAEAEALLRTGWRPS